MTSTTRMLMSALDATAGDKNVALVLADELQDRIGERATALRIVAALRRSAVVRGAVPRAVKLLGQDLDPRGELRAFVCSESLAPYQPSSAVVVEPGACYPCWSRGALPRRMKPGAAAVLPVLPEPLPQYARRAQRVHIIVGAVWVVRLAKLLRTGRGRLPHPEPSREVARERV